MTKKVTKAKFMLLTYADIRSVQRKVEELYSVVNMITESNEIDIAAPPDFDSYDVIRVMNLLNRDLLEIANHLAGLAGSLKQGIPDRRDTLAIPING